VGFLALLRELDVDRPGFDRDELADLVLAVDDQAQCDRGDAAGPNALLDLAPQERAEPESDHAVDHAPRLLGVDASHVEAAGRLQRPAHGLRGDLVELDALGVADLQHLGQVPGDGLAFPVGVRGQDDLLVLLGRRAKLGDRLAAALDHLVVRLEAVVDLDAHLLFGQVADVAHRGPDVVAVSQEPLQSPGLGRRLDDDQTFWHSSLTIPKTGSCSSGGRGRRPDGASYARSLPRRNALTYPPWCRLTA